MTWEVSARWDRHFLGLAHQHALMSKDPSTKVGAVLVGPRREILSAGFNGLPRGIEDSLARLEDRDLKLKLIVHAEMNAILAAAMNGVKVLGSVLYISATDSSGAVWGGPPCTRCTVEALQAGVIEFVSWPLKLTPSRWHADCKFAAEIIDEAKCCYREVE